MKNLTLFLLMSLISTEINSQINLDDELYSKISSTARLKQRDEASQPFAGSTFKVITYSRIKSIEYTIDGGDVNVLTDQITYLPDQYIVHYYSNKNCSDDRRGWTQNLTMKVSQGQLYKISNSVKSSKKTSYSLGFKIPIPKIGIDFSGSTSTEVTFETSSSQEEQRSITTEETVTKTINFDVNPKKELFVKFQTTKYTLRVPFEATLFINGYVVVQNVLRVELHGKVSEGISEENIPISKLLNEEQLRFSITGFLENSKAGKEEVEYAEVPLPADSCEQISIENPFVLISEKIVANQPLSKEEKQSLKKPTDFFIRKDLDEGIRESDETVKALNLNFEKKQ